MIGFVVDARRKIVSRRIGAPLPKASADRIDMLLAAPADERDEAGQPAALDVTAHDLVHALEPRRRQSAGADCSPLSCQQPSIPACIAHDGLPQLNRGS